MDLPNKDKPVTQNTILMRQVSTLPTEKRPTARSPRAVERLLVSIRDTPQGLGWHRGNLKAVDSACVRQGLNFLGPRKYLIAAEIPNPWSRGGVRWAGQAQGGGSNEQHHSPGRF
jgi:hypothetical protein